MFLSLTPAAVFGENISEDVEEHVFEPIDENNINVLETETEILNLEKCDSSEEHQDENEDAVCDICGDLLEVYILKDDQKIYYETFEKAISDAEDDDTVYLIRDVVLENVVEISKKITVTSHTDENAPYQITTQTNKHGYLISVADKELILKNIVIDGGSANQLTAQRAMIAVNGGTLKVQEGTVIRNNKNTVSKGVGGGICVISGNAYINGASFENNFGYYGGGIGMVAGECYIQSTRFNKNFAAIGGGICVWEIRNVSAGTLRLLDDVVITDNEAQYYAGGVDCNMNGVIYITGKAVIKDNKSAEESNDGGIYLDGNGKNGRGKVNISELPEGTQISFLAFNGPVGMLVASPIGEYQIKQADLDKMSYLSDTVCLELSEDGMIRLACAHKDVNEDGSCSECLKPVYTVLISCDKADGAYFADEAITLQYKADFRENDASSLELQWFIDDEKTELSALTFNLDLGTYRIYCIASNGKYSVKSNTLTITVDERIPEETIPPVIDNTSNTNSKYPQTGDGAYGVLWLLSLLISGGIGVFMLTGIYAKKKNYFVK